MLSRRCRPDLRATCSPLSGRGRQALLSVAQGQLPHRLAQQRALRAQLTEHEVTDHLHTGLDADRQHCHPVAGQHVRLEGWRVLDIGCGTGSSTVALAEQGALVTGIDVDAASLRVAHDRCRLYGLEAKLALTERRRDRQVRRRTRSTWCCSPASLEHMTKRRAAGRAERRLADPAGRRPALGGRHAEPPLVFRPAHLAAAVLQLAAERPRVRLQPFQPAREFPRVCTRRATGTR